MEPQCLDVLAHAGEATWWQDSVGTLTSELGWHFILPPPS